MSFVESLKRKYRTYLELAKDPTLMEYFLEGKEPIGVTEFRFGLYRCRIEYCRKSPYLGELGRVIKDYHYIKTKDFLTWANKITGED